MGEMGLTKLGCEILKWLQENRPVIAEQCREAEISKAEHTGTGCFFELAVNSRATSLCENLKRVEGPEIKSSSLSHGAGSIIFCESGVIRLLEVFSYEGDFPEEIDGVRFSESDFKKDYSK